MFDFETSNWPKDMRITYKMTKWLFLNASYDYCKNVLTILNLPENNSNHRTSWLDTESEYAYAYEQCEGLFSRPIELLMHEVVALILDAKRSGHTFQIYHHNNITKILKDHDIESMLMELPQAERTEFEHDLKLLGLI